MKREIEFRGQTSKGEWVYGCLLNNKHDRIGFYNNVYKFEINAVIPETVGQYTGITDKNGKKIFEGDIVSIDGKNYEVKYLLGQFFVGINMPIAYKRFECEVIGNIFDKERDDGRED